MLRTSLPLFQVHPEGKFVVDVDKNIDINDVSVCSVISGLPEPLVGCVCVCFLLSWGCSSFKMSPKAVTVVCR